MIQRCTNPKNPRFKDYGGRNITICERWLKSFDNFLDDMGAKPTLKHSIERKENDGDYCQSNCKWATDIEQANNRRKQHNNTSGHVGVTYEPRWGGCWRARVNVNGKRIFIGNFKTIEDAINARSRYKNQQNF